ncbi:MAG TPA: hypothetical protein EYG51_22245 [Pseudomonadales bacterium]|nr:hypothetical protein [Pseudomonadales bacterium]
MKVGDLVNWELCALEAMMLGLGDYIPLEGVTVHNRAIFKFKIRGLLCELYDVGLLGRVAKVLFPAGELLDVYPKYLEVMDECR